MGTIEIMITLLILIFFSTWYVDYIKVKGDLAFSVSCASSVLCDCGFFCLLPLPSAIYFHFHVNSKALETIFFQSGWSFTSCHSVLLLLVSLSLEVPSLFLAKQQH